MGFKERTVNKSKSSGYLFGFLMILMTGCTTIKPTVSNDLFVACTALCKKKNNLESVTTNIELNYYGRMKLISNTCTCKNNELIDLIAPGEYIF